MSAREAAIVAQRTTSDDRFQPAEPDAAQDLDADVRRTEPRVPTAADRRHGGAFVEMLLSSVVGLVASLVLSVDAVRLAVGLAYVGAMSPEKMALYVGGGCAIFTALTNYWFKRKTYLYLTSLGLDKGAIREINR